MHNVKLFLKTSMTYCRHFFSLRLINIVLQGMRCVVSFLRNDNNIVGEGHCALPEKGCIENAGPARRPAPTKRVINGVSSSPGGSSQ